MVLQTRALFLQQETNRLSSRTDRVSGQACDEPPQLFKVTKSKLLLSKSSRNPPPPSYLFQAMKARESGLSLSDMKQIFWRWVRDGNFDIQELLLSLHVCSDLEFLRFS